MRRKGKPAKAKVKARRPVARKPPKGDASGRGDLAKRLAESLKREKALGEILREKDRALTEALEQRTATAEILKVIAGTPTDAQPVFDTIVRNAGRVCDAVDTVLTIRTDDIVTIRAHWGPIGAPVGTRFPMTRGSVMGRAILDARPIQVEDLLTASEFPEGRELAIRFGHRTTLGVPLLREGEALGALVIRRMEVRPFSDAQIATLQSFADQAVIAIENVRLFTELQASNRELTTALDQQTATSDILRVISQAQTDVQPVFDAIVKSAVRLLGAYAGTVSRVAGDQLELAAFTSIDAAADAAVGAAYPRPLQFESGITQAVRNGAPVNIADYQTHPGLSEAEHARARVRGFRSLVAVPLLRHGEAVGAIAVTRREPGGFTGDEIALLKTFADQAVIAIENVRLFTELEGRNRDLTATSEILRVISQSPTDLMPVFESIARSAATLCGGLMGGVFQYDGNLMHLGAMVNFAHGAGESWGQQYPRAASHDTASGRAILERVVVIVPDVEADSDRAEWAREVARAGGYRSAIAAPMLREGVPIGVILVCRVEAGPFPDQQVALLKTFADQAVIAVENVRLFNELQASNRELTTALDQQTATSDILRVISQSQTDVQPVFDAILSSAARLLGTDTGVLSRVAGDQIELAALMSTDAAGDAALRATFPRPFESATPHALVIRERAPLNIADTQRDPRLSEGLHAAARVRGIRSQVVVPLLRHEEAIGAIGVSRREPGGFTDDEIALLKTFADQAVIAIENVRLFTELEGRNRDLTATSEILRVISSSPTDVQPVFDTIVGSAVRLCDGLFSALFRFDGEMLHHVAQHNFTPEALEEMHRIYPMLPTRAQGPGRAIVERAVAHIPDVDLDPDFPDRTLSRAIGWRSGLFVPMLRESVPIGVVAVARAEPGPFSDSEIELLKTFADQAVIAIENVRLFTELKASNRELTTALDQQTATSDILRVISQSQTDVQPVFDAILVSAVRLLGGLTGVLTRVSGDQIELAAFTRTDAVGDASLRAIFPQPLHSEAPHAQVVRDRAPLNIADTHTDPRVSENVHVSARARGYRSWVTVPLLRQGEAVGTIAVTRPAPGGFTHEEIALLKTFADQAVIAIENVRLFTELEARNRDLTEALEQQTATGEILGVISRSPTDIQPIFDVIVRNAVRLSDALFSTVILTKGDALQLGAAHGFAGDALATLERSFPASRDVDLPSGQAIREGSVVHLPDAQASRFGAWARALGMHSYVSVPMFRGGQAIGAIAIAHREAGPFSDRQISLLRIFADQAVIAIENVRLFKELQARTSELTRSVDQLTALGEISRAVSSTLDVETVLQTIVSRASELAGADGCAIYEYDDGTQAFHIRATHNLDPILVGTLRASPLRKGEGTMGRAAETREPTQVADIAVPGAYQSHIRDMLVGAGYRALLSVPLLSEGEVIGSLSLNRRAPGEFPPEAVEVLKTFATQSALAIQNARLFREIADKSAQLEAASRHKSEFLANMSHELRTPLNAIIGFSEVLVDRMFGELNDKQEEYLKDIYASGQHLLSLINDILDLSKIEAGRMELEVANFDLPSAIDNALTLVRERASRRGITLWHSVDDRLGQIRGDERKVKQVLLNLLSNALKFTPEGGRIDVSARVNDAVAEVSVADTGVGIAPEDQEAVFEEFRQVGAADKKVEGTGLGLALSRKFIELHGGRIWVKSQVGQGSTFTFTLPLRRDL